MAGKLNAEEIEELLLQQNAGHIGCSNKGKTYVVPVNYVYDGKYIFVQSVEGLKLKIMRANPRVCFEVECIQNNRNWKTVITQGIYQEIVHERERYDAMKLFVDKKMKLTTSPVSLSPEINEQRLHPQTGKQKPVLYRILLLEKTGRCENG